MRKFDLNKLTPMLDKENAGITKTGKAVVDIVKDRNFQIGVLTALPTTVSAFFLSKGIKGKLKRKRHCTRRYLPSTMQS